MVNLNTRLGPALGVHSIRRILRPVKPQCRSLISSFTQFVWHNVPEFRLMESPTEHRRSCCDGKRPQKSIELTRERTYSLDLSQNFDSMSSHIASETLVLSWLLGLRTVWPLWRGLPLPQFAAAVWGLRGDALNLEMHVSLLLTSLAVFVWLGEDPKLKNSIWTRPSGL